MRSFASALLLALACVVLSSCVSTKDEATVKEQEAGGALPWNRPEKWEGGGAMGSQLNQMQGGGGGSGPFN